MKTLLILLVCVSIGESYFFDLEFDLHGGLREGNQLPLQTGGYLKDRFRTTIIGPVIQQIVKRLKEQRRENVLQDLLIFTVGVILVIGMIDEILGPKGASPS